MNNDANAIPSTFEEFESAFGSETMSRVLMEQLALTFEQARRFREIESALSEDGVTVERIREILK